jgi:fluoride exporter
MRMILIVGLGGFLGSSIRFIIQKYFSFVSSSLFPFPTLLINLTGCLMIGILFGLASKYNILSNEMRLFLTTGFCGGFTTFSTFSNESFILLKEGNLQYFVLYVVLSVVLGIFLTFIGYSIFKVI